MAPQGQAIAIIGMAGRFPGAQNIEELRQNLLDGVESISFFDDDELRAAGATQAELDDPTYVRAAPMIGDIDMFDASLFGMSAREAQLLDPQFRVFLESCHAALLQAGVTPSDRRHRIGVYAGSKDNSYLDEHIVRNSAVWRATGSLMALINNHTDYLSTGVAYRLGLTGPAVSMVTACSTSLVAIHSAVRALRAGECEVALAGGVEIGIPEVTGYNYKEGGIYSPDGHVRPFDAKARGTVFGSGCGAVVLKPLEQALADRNPIHAVIRGSAINNDGNQKSGFFAPSKPGQVAVVNAALADAGVDPDTIGYVEAHGTGTLIGDPVEVGALSEAFRSHTDRRSYCAIASVKANVGHLGAAAGVTGLVNAVCSVRDGRLAPVINFDEPNPRIDFAQSPFYVNLAPATWDSGARPRRAAVSSFGIGGTNANVIIEQAPPRPESPPSRRPVQLLALSAHTPAALDALTEDLKGFLAGTSPLPDVSYTLTVGRDPLPQRRFVLASDSAQAQEALTVDLPAFEAKPGRTATFLFPGQGSQYPGMAAELYRAEPVFRDELDACAAVLRESHGLDLLALMFEADAQTQNQTCHAQPLLFAVEYALSKTLQAMGIQPAAMAGHSVGEFVAATLAGVFSRDDALRLVAERGALMQSVDSGAMLAVTLPEELLLPYLDGSVDLAVVNAPGVCVVSGTHDDIQRLEEELSLQGIATRPLHTSHAFHSRMMEPILERFEQAVRAVAMRPPAIPFVSNLTGTWIADDEATDPGYWVRHLRNCVRFSDTLRLLTTDGDRALLEVGPGRTLTGYVTAHDRSAVAVPVMRHVKQQQSDVSSLLSAIGRAWAEGVEVDWARFWGGEERYLVGLPEYPYQRQRYWIDPDEPAEAAAASPVNVGAYTAPVWLESVTPPARPVEGLWVMLGRPGDPVLGRLGELAERAGAKVVTADTDARAVDTMVELAGESRQKVTVVHGLTLGQRPAEVSEADHAGTWLELGFHSGLRLLQETARRMPGVPIELIVVSSQMQDVSGDGRIEPAKAAVLGLVKLAPKEMESVTCRSIDICAECLPDQVAAQLFAEISAGTAEQVAYRGRKRWTWSYTGVELESPSAAPVKLKHGGVYLLTGGLGGLGLVLARQLSEMVSARVVLLGRNGLPERERWDAVLAESPDGGTARRIRGVRAAEAAGGQVLVVAADITDEARMREVRVEIEQAFGPVDGVFHLAAVAGGGMLETRTREDAEAVFAPKVRGTYVLDKVFRPDLMVLYSSIAVLSADFGLGDYVGANAVLDAFAQARWAEGRHTISVNWPPFAEVGMAHEINAPSIMAQLAWAPDAAEDDTRDRPGHPMLLRRSDPDGADEGHARFEVNLSHALWVLAEHRITGDPTMPGTGTVELIRAAFAEVTGEDNARLSELVFLLPLTATPGLRAFLDLRPRTDGRYDITITGSDDKEYARGVVGGSDAQPGDRHDLEALREATEQAPPANLEALSHAISFGPRWRGITNRRAAAGLDVVTIELPADLRADLDRFHLHPAILDCCVTIGQTIRNDGLYLPFSYDRITVKGPLPARVHSIIRHLDDTTGDTTSADITVVDDDGNELVVIERFIMVCVYGEAADALSARPQPAAPASDLTSDVRPEDGEEALRLILGSGFGPQVIWCPEGLDSRIRRTSRITRSSVTEQMTASTGAAGGSGAARTLTTPYVEPAGELERGLAQLWSETLGVERIGAEDDFFDLGGNSLFAVQLVSRISQRFTVDVSAASLFDARNVRTLAGTIERALVEKVSSLSEEQAREALRAMGLAADA